MSQMWDEIHQRYKGQDWILKPSLFAEWAAQFFSKKGSMLELGAGQGQDSVYFSSLGFLVTSTDFSDQALKLSRASGKRGVVLQWLDLSQPFPYKDETFSVVYAHLSVHYFDEATTYRLFAEIERVLKPGGVVALLTNSIHDPECGTGQKLEEDLFEVSPGFIKRFFSLESMRKFTTSFDTIVLDEDGETYKDNAIGVKNLIRYVGRKYKG